MAAPCIVIYKGKRYTKEEFMDELLKNEELSQYIGKQFEKPLTPRTDAIQEPRTTEGVLRQERPELGLQEVVQGDKGQAPTGKVTSPAEVTSLKGVKYSDIIVGDKRLEDILSDNKLSNDEKQQVREIFNRGVDYFKFNKESERKFQEKFANPEDITDVADIITGVDVSQQSAWNNYNTRNYENVRDAVNYIVNNPNEYTEKIVKTVKEIKDKIDNPSSSMNRLYAIDVMKELGIKEEPAELSPIEAKKQQLRSDIDRLSSEVHRKTALSSGGQFQALPQVIEIVGKYTQLGMLNLESIAKDLIEKGYSRVLPKLKEAYNAYLKTDEAKALGLDPIADRIKDFDHQALIDEAIKEAKAESKDVLQKSIDHLTKELFPEEPGKKPVIQGGQRAGIVRRVVQAPFKVLDKAQEATVGKLIDNVSETMKQSFEQRMMNPDNKGAKAIVLDMINTLFKPTQEARYEKRGEQLYGQMETGKLYASGILHRLHDLYGINKESVNKVHKVLDPDFYRVKSQAEYEREMADAIGQDAFDQLKQQDPDYIDQVYSDYRIQVEGQGGEKLPTIDDLTDNEKQYYETIRAAGDAIHSANMLSGLMGLDTYTVNKFKYVPRMYEVIEKNQEIARLEGTRKQALDIFKTKEEVDEWKMTNRITDPSYLMAKRMQQAFRNKAIADYAKWVESKYGRKIIDPLSVKDIPANYVKLGAGYGVLSNKYVPLSLAEDFKGFMFTSEYAQKAYDVLKAYDQIAPRRFYKNLWTKWMPSTQVSNVVANIQFAALMNIDPVSYNRNFGWANGERKAGGSDYRYLLSKGLLKNSMTQDNYIEALNKFEANMDEVTNSKSPLKIMKAGADWASDIYEIADDNAKMAAWKTLIEMGIDKDEAIKRVSVGFQNYTRLPKIYDVAARTPLISSPFARFKADLARIVVSNAARRPLTMLGYLYVLGAASNYFSSISGESEDERKVREARKGAPKIPFLDIPLTWKIEGAELNIARYLAPYYTFETYDGSDFTNAINKVLPYDYTPVPEDSKHPDGPWASWFGIVNKDPMTAVLNLAWNADFQGRPISDPYATNYKEGTASSKTKAYNKARYLSAAYLPFGRQGLDIYDAIQMQTNPELKEQYTKQGRQILTPGQALARTFGVKLQQVTDLKYKQMLESQVDKIAHDFDVESQKLNTIRKNFQDGRISEDEAMSSMAEVLENLGEMTNKVSEFQGKFTSEEFKTMQDEFFMDYEGYLNSTYRYEEAKESPEEFLQSPVRKGGSRRRSSGMGGLTGGSMSGF